LSQEDDETFTVELVAEDMTPGAVLGNCRVCEVTIQDDDCPGEFAFARDWVSVKENDGRVWLEVVRKVGCKGDVSVAWATKDGSAVAPNDYTAASGTMHFAPGVTPAMLEHVSSKMSHVVTRPHVVTRGQVTAERISVPIRDDGRFDMDEEFEVSAASHLA
jgi:hypothetical protein